MHLHLYLQLYVHVYVLLWQFASSSPSPNHLHQKNLLTNNRTPLMPFNLFQLSSFIFHLRSSTFHQTGAMQMRLPYKLVTSYAPTASTTLGMRRRSRHTRRRYAYHTPYTCYWYIYAAGTCYMLYATCYTYLYGSSEIQTMI